MEYCVCCFYFEMNTKRRKNLSISTGTLIKYILGKPNKFCKCMWNAQVSFAFIENVEGKNQMDITVDFNLT